VAAIDYPGKWRASAVGTWRLPARPVEHSEQHKVPPLAYLYLVRDARWMGVKVARQVARSLIGVIGCGLLVLGAIKLASASNDTGSVVLVIAGALLLVSPFIIDRVERLSVSTGGLELHLSREISGLGAPKMARVLERTDLAKFAESYAFVHEELNNGPYRPAKIHLQDLLVERAAGISAREKIDATEARTLFRNGSPMIRVLTLGLMQGDPSLADGTTVLSSIADSRTANEQFQGLKLAVLCWHNLARTDRQAIRAAIESSPYIRPGTDRQLLAAELLDLPV